MGRMAELDIEIHARLKAGYSHDEIAFVLDIPKHWISEMIEENAFADYMELRCRDLTRFLDEAL